MKLDHTTLVKRAASWLRAQGCAVVLTEFVTCGSHGEVPDAIGWRHYGQTSMLVECKTSRADFRVDSQKQFRRNPEYGMGAWRFFLCPPGVIEVSELPPGWGLLYAEGRSVKRVHNVPAPREWYRHRPPFKANQNAEVTMMMSALRRLDECGALKLIYSERTRKSLFGVSDTADVVRAQESILS